MSTSNGVYDRPMTFTAIADRIRGELDRPAEKGQTMKTDDARELENVPYFVDEYTVDELSGLAGYQRGLRETWVARIMKDWDWDQLTPVVVSWRADGTIYVIDGQHRIEAAKRLGYGDKKLPCIVYEGLTLEEEASLFHRLNRDQKPLQRHEEMHAALMYNDPVAVDIRHIVEKNGYRLNLRSGEGTDWTKNGITAIGTLYRVYGDYQEGVLDETLQVIRATYGTDMYPSASLMMAIASFVSRYRGMYDQRVLAKKLAPVLPDTLQIEGANVKRVLGGTIPDATGQYILKVYNGGRRTNRLPEWAEMKKGGGVRPSRDRGTTDRRSGGRSVKAKGASSGK